MSRRLLIVDDEPNLLRAVAACLRSEGYEVRTARSSRDALVNLAESVPDLIISDVRMPGMDGHSLVQRIRSSPRTAMVPVVFLTAKDQREDRVEGFRTGVDAYVTKPFEPDELLAVLAAIFDRVERTRREFSRLMGAIETARPAQVDGLTDAELRIAEAVAQGLSNKEIAVEFAISVRTVENHVSHILAKRGFNSRVEIARLVIERKLAN